jgi:hypothetical protein
MLTLFKMALDVLGMRLFLLRLLLGCRASG